MTNEPKITLKVKVDNILQMISNKVTSWSNTPSNDKYPSEKLVKDSLDGKANLSHNHDDRYYTESEIVDFLNKKIDLDCEFINGWWNSNQTYNLRGKSVKDLNTLRRDGKKFIYKVPDFSDMNYDNNELYLKMETSNSTYGVVGKLYYNENTIYVRDAKTLFMNKYLLIEHIQDGNFDKYYILDIFNIFHNHNDVYYTKSEMDNNISGKEDTSNKLTSLQSLDDYSTDTQYASAKLIHKYLETKEDTSNKVTSMTAISTDDEYPSAKCVYDKIEERIDDVFGYIPQDLRAMAYEDNVDGYVGAVALSNDYDDLDNKPTIPTATSDLTNDGDDGTNPFLTEHQSLGNYVQKSQTNGLLKNDGTIVQSGTGANNWATGNHTHSEYVNPTIIDNLTTDDATKVLSAKQGKVLNDMIGDAISYINGSGN